MVKLLLSQGDIKINRLGFVALYTKRIYWGFADLFGILQLGSRLHRYTRTAHNSNSNTILWSKIPLLVEQPKKVNPCMFEYA